LAVWHHRTIFAGTGASDGAAVSWGLGLAAVGSVAGNEPVILAPFAHTHGGEPMTKIEDVPTVLEEADDAEADLEVDEVLVEEISIDGMCGVY
jgi:mycofactocin precursor